MKTAADKWVKTDEWKKRFDFSVHSGYLLRMKKNKCHPGITFKRILPKIAMAVLFILCFNSFSYAEDLKKVVQLSGYWRFSIGDYEEWASPEFNDSKWDEIRVPSRWEDQGYQDYNGYAWYRKKFRMYEVNNNLPLYLMLGRIDDVDEVYINGQRLAVSGSFPPHYISAYNQQRKYHIPREILKTDEPNTIAVRVFDEYGEGGIIDNPVGIYVDEEYAEMDYILPGKWKFHLGDNSQWKAPSYDDSGWNQINVPSAWENEGYSDYDGYAWYRVEFTLPANLREEKLYLALGKIDDVDYVYLNGHLIGSVYDLPKDREYKYDGYEYNARRVYEIPSDLIKQHGKNLIAIRVYDGQIRGGIYEGPLGLMTYPTYKSYRRKHYSNQSFIDYLIDEFVID